MLTWNRILAGERSERPEPLIRLSPEFFEYQWNRRGPHADDLLIRRLRDEFAEAGRRPAFVMPSIHQADKTIAESVLHPRQLRVEPPISAQPNAPYVDNFV